MSGGKTEAIDKGDNAVVGTGWFVFGGDAYGGLGGGDDGGRRGEIQEILGMRCFLYTGDDSFQNLRKGVCFY